MKRNFTIFLFLVTLLLSAQAQEQPVRPSEVPEDLKQEIITEYFNDNFSLGILWEHYRTTTFILLLVALGFMVGMRNYARSVARQEQRIFDTLQSNAFILFDRGSDLRLMNRAAKQLLGLDEFVSMSEDYKYYLKNAPSPEILDVFEEVRDNRHAVEREVVFNHNKVMRTLIVKAYPYYSESKRLDGFIMIIADITEAIEKDRRVNWSGVAQHVAHKAKTPLSTITLTAQHLEMLLTERENTPAEEITRYIDRIVGESRKLNEIVHNLTRLANKEQMNLLPNDVNIILQNISDEYRTKVTRNIDIITHFYRSLPKVGIDIAHFPEAVENLLDNAIRAVGTRDGRIIIATAPGQWINRPGEYVEITIQDTGIGMDDEVKKSIFRPFSTHSKGGTGLGLVIVQKIVQEHNGEITFNSSPGLGTTFQIRLPVTKY
ncbi:MAG: GHKL domain-containing protein [Bacteroidetes bacterium]|nr:GHKL domain-containing protein [Bacteroidota bacterium]